MSDWYLNWTNVQFVYCQPTQIFWERFALHNHSLHFNSTEIAIFLFTLVFATNQIHVPRFSLLWFDESIACQWLNICLYFVALPDSSGIGWSSLMDMLKIISIFSIVPLNNFICSPNLNDLLQRFPIETVLMCKMLLSWSFEKALQKSTEAKIINCWNIFASSHYYLVICLYVTSHNFANVIKSELVIIHLRWRCDSTATFLLTEDKSFISSFFPGAT